MFYICCLLLGSKWAQVHPIRNFFFCKNINDTNTYYKENMRPLFNYVSFYEWMDCEECIRKNVIHYRWFKIRPFLLCLYVRPFIFRSIIASVDLDCGRREDNWSFCLHLSYMYFIFHSVFCNKEINSPFSSLQDPRLQNK